MLSIDPNDVILYFKYAVGIPSKNHFLNILQGRIVILTRKASRVVYEDNMVFHRVICDMEQFLSDWCFKAASPCNPPGIMTIEPKQARRLDVSKNVRKYIGAITVNYSDVSILGEPFFRPLIKSFVNFLWKRFS